MSTDTGNDRLSAQRAAILGLGLMGGSLALALHGQCRSLVGIDPDLNTLRLAETLQIFDRLSDRPEAILAGCSLVVLAAPVREIIRLLGALPDLHPGPAVVIDLGSSKVEILRAMQSLPPCFDPLGGHPMCGKERGGLANADPALFRQRIFVFTRLDRTTPAACSLAGQVASAVGALPRWLDAETHDRWIAATSHLPYLAACALALAVPEEAAPLAGPGFASTTRLASSPASMMLDVLLTNRVNLLNELQGFRSQLERLERSLERWDEGALKGLLDDAAARRENLLFTPPGGGQL